MKPKKRQHFRNDELDELQPKRKRKLPKEKYRLQHLWIEEDWEELQDQDNEATIIPISNNWGLA